MPTPMAPTFVPTASPLHASGPALGMKAPVREEVRVGALVPRSEPPPAVAPATSTGTALPTAIETASVREALSRYGAAYSQLDAVAARAVFPTVDARALGRAFAELRSQRVTFDGCDITVDGGRARAACRGATTYVPRAGDPGPRTEPMAWRFELEKGGDANWRIASATVSAPPGSTRGR